MSVDRNYTVQISAVADSVAQPSAQRKWTHASPERSDDNREEILPRAVLNREIDRVLSDTGGAIISPALSASSKEKTDETFSDESTMEAMRYSGAFHEVNREFAGNHADARVNSETSQSHSKVNAEDRSELVNQVRQLQAAFHTQARVLTGKDVVEMLSAVRQLREMFLDQQRKSVSRQELKSELQTLRLVMEGRK